VELALVAEVAEVAEEVVEVVRATVEAKNLIEGDWIGVCFHHICHMLYEG
jgi:hypothetical protein